MLVFHAAIAEDGALLCWAEQPLHARADGAALAARSHPSAADHATLRELVVADGRAISFDAHLPTLDGAPLPSSDLLTGDHPGQPTVEQDCVLEPWQVPALRLDPDAALDLLGAAGTSARPLRTGVLPGSDVVALAQLVRIASAIVLRQELLPDVAWLRDGGASVAADTELPPRLLARWNPLPGPAMRDALDEAARRLPDAVLAASPPGTPRLQVAERFVATLVDALARARVTGPDAPQLTLDPPASMHDRWLAALTSTDTPMVDGPPDALDRLVEEVGQWQQRLRRRAQSAFRLVMRLEEPDDPTDDATDAGSVWTLRYLLQMREDPSVLVAVADAWKPTGPERGLLAQHGFHAGEHVLAPLGEAAHLFEPIADSLGTATPGSCELTTAQAHHFLSEVVPLLEQSGIGVFVPAWWRSRGGRWQLGLRAQLRTDLTGGRRSLDSLNLATLVEYDWRVALGDEQLTRDELTRLAAQKSGLVKIRGRWVEVDASELRAALEHLDRFEADPLEPSRGAHTATLGELLARDLPASAITDPSGTGIVEALTTAAREAPLEQLAPPAGLRAELRPYQLRGYAWLAAMARLGLGACLADDMGLGKSVQALAAIQHAWEQSDAPRQPTLLVCPTSVLTNWSRECEKFVPDLPVVVHHGPARARGADFAKQSADVAIVVTSYALLARDVADLRDVPWRMLVLDETQNIKNPGTRAAVAARSIRAPARVALTGTPVENHVGDLWSIMEFLNPGLLGSQADFRRRYMLPIQSGSFPEANERLRRLTAPFVLRREKTDRAVIEDLPDKFETTAFCSLTTEQVTLYEAIVREAETILRMSGTQSRMSGIERRGTILATLSRLKQACNHPAQLLGDNSSVAGRSGKLARLEELLETVLEQGERALVFTQFVQMGELLHRHLPEVFGREALFLHGGTSRAARDRIVERFQSLDAGAPPILVLSLKAGGSGLNLTAATHVIHYDRWWNPATEQQASDRAFRIGQTRDVQVHALVCAGTVEERIDRMLRQKREVAESIVGSGEQWIGELEDDELLDLVRLRSDTLLQAGRLDSIDPKEWQHVPL